jgi:hypothetical protein
MHFMVSYIMKMNTLVLNLNRSDRKICLFQSAAKQMLPVNGKFEKYPLLNQLNK